MNQNNFLQKLGFTPLNENEIYNISPKLKELFEKFQEFDVFFKEPEHSNIIVNANQKLMQGSLVIPQSNEIIDFEMSTDYLMTNANLITMFRKDDHTTWGDYQLINKQESFSDIKGLTERFTNVLSQSAAITSTHNSKGLEQANKNLSEKLVEHNNFLKINQRKPDKMDENYQEKINPHKIMNYRD